MTVVAAPQATRIVTDPSETASAGRRLLLQNLDQRLAEPRGRGRDLDTSFFHRGDLRFGVALAACDDRTRMPHAAAGRRGAARDEAHHRLLATLCLILEKLRGILLGAAA